MKKTLSINLGGMVFNMDEDAFDMLREYLAGIERYFANDAERKEIMDDIESRIAELLQEKFSNQKQVVTLADVREVIGILGNPDEIGSSSQEEEEPPRETRSHSTVQLRLYRDPDIRMLGGVSGGLGAYFNVDPVIFRILFVVFTLVGGSGLLVYIILWIVVPEARTRAQKMEMRGEPVTIDSIGKTVRDEFEQLKKNMNFRKKSKRSNE